MYRPHMPSMTATAMSTIARPRSGSPLALPAAARVDAPEDASVEASVGVDSAELSEFTLVTAVTLASSCRVLGHSPLRRAAPLRAGHAPAASAPPERDTRRRQRGRREARLSAGDSAPVRYPAGCEWPPPWVRYRAARGIRTPRWRRLGLTRSACLNCRA